MEPTTTTAVVIPGPGQLLLASVLIGAGFTAGAITVSLGAAKLQAHLASKKLEEELADLEEEEVEEEVEEAAS